ncbi:unnamed protein product, partial [Staurois parvus]
KRSVLSALEGCRTPDLCLDSADWPCAGHIHSPRKEKKKPLAIHTKLSMCTVTPLLSGEGEDQRTEDQTAFFTQCRGLTP